MNKIDKTVKRLQLKELYSGFRDAEVIKSYAVLIHKLSKNLQKPLNIMEVCGGHTHTIMKYGLKQLLPSNINFIHGPGCPVCIMPKERINHALILSKLPDVILVTLGDMIKVPGSDGSLQDARAQGADVRFVYSPMDCIKISHDNPEKKVIFFAIGFETTTPMSAALINKVVKEKIGNIIFHINHVTIPEAMALLLEDNSHNINAFIGPSHVSVISGSKIYEPFPKIYKKPVVVSGFEPVDVMKSIVMLIEQVLDNRCEVEVEYSRSVSYDGNVQAQKLNNSYFEKREHFRWRGIGDITSSALKLKPEFSFIDAEKIYEAILPTQEINDHKLCICGDILKGKASPQNCNIFGTLCKPSHPVGSCMVSSEGACAAYYKYGDIL